jgi:hypothetical protein
LLAEVGFLFCVCICFCLQKLDFLFHILYPFAFICFLSEIGFRSCYFGCICLHLFGLSRLDSGTKMSQQARTTPPPQSSPHTRFPNVEGEFSMPATEQWWVHSKNGQCTLLLDEVRPSHSVKTGFQLRYL